MGLPTISTEQTLIPNTRPYTRVTSDWDLAHMRAYHATSTASPNTYCIRSIAITAYDPTRFTSHVHIALAA